MSGQGKTDVMQAIQNLISGAAVTSANGRSAPVFNPATGEQTGELGLSSADEVGAAVAAAKSAFPEWADTPPLRRARFMFRFKDLLEQRAADVARAISAERRLMVATD